MFFCFLRSNFRACRLTFKSHHQFQYYPTGPLIVRLFSNKWSKSGSYWFTLWYSPQHYIAIFFIYISGFNRCPFQLPRSYKRHEENKRLIGQERSSMQQAHYQCHRPTPWMQESVSMHKSPTPVRHSRMNQARSEEEEKERKRDRKERQPNKTKTYPMNWNKACLGTAQGNKAGGGTPCPHSYTVHKEASLSGSHGQHQNLLD